MEELWPHLRRHPFRDGLISSGIYDLPLSVARFIAEKCAYLPLGRASEVHHAPSASSLERFLHSSDLIGVFKATSYMTLLVVAPLGLLVALASQSGLVYLLAALVPVVALMCIGPVARLIRRRLAKSSVHLHSWRLLPEHHLLLTFVEQQRRHVALKANPEVDALHEEVVELVKVREELVRSAPLEGRVPVEVAALEVLDEQIQEHLSRIADLVGRPDLPAEASIPRLADRTALAERILAEKSAASEVQGRLRA